MRVELHRLPDNICALCARASEKLHFIHCVQKLSVRRLETVDFRDCARYYYAHGIGHVIFFKRFRYALLRHKYVFIFHYSFLRCAASARFFNPHGKPEITFKINYSTKIAFCLLCNNEIFHFRQHRIHCKKNDNLRLFRSHHCMLRENPNHVLNIT